MPSREELSLELGAQARRLVSAIDRYIVEPKDRARAASRRLTTAMTRQLAPRQAMLAGLAGRLHALSPLATLERGYAVARDAGGRTLGSVREFAEGEPFVLRVRDGEVDASASAIRPLGAASP